MLRYKNNFKNALNHNNWSKIEVKSQSSRLVYHLIDLLKDQWPRCVADTWIRHIETLTALSIFQELKAHSIASWLQRFYRLKKFETYEMEFMKNLH